jgi:triacylglycerol lipase
MSLELDAAQAYRVGSLVETAYRAFTPGLLAPQPSLLPAGWRVLTELTAVDHAAGRSEPEFFGFVLQSGVDGEVLVAIRGTDTFLEWLVDAEFLPCTFPAAPSAGKVEDGFCSVYTSLRCSSNGGAPAALIDRLSSGTRVTVAGHSLGASVATLLALEIAVRVANVQLDLFTYASPRVGDRAFAGFCTRRVPSHYRIVNRPDIVPHLPPAYEHTGTEFDVDSKAQPTIAHSVACYHTLTTYLWLLNQQSQYGLGNCARRE